MPIKQARWETRTSLGLQVNLPCYTQTSPQNAGITVSFQKHGWIVALSSVSSLEKMDMMSGRVTKELVAHFAGLIVTLWLRGHWSVTAKEISCN